MDFIPTAAALAVHRDRRYHKLVDEMARYLSGNWREEHLFNLASALKLYDTVEEMITSYDARLLQEMKALQAPERREKPVPRHPNPAKESALKSRGEQKARTQLWRFAAVDLTRIDEISATTAQIVLIEVGADLSAFPTENHFVSWLRLCPQTSISGGKPLKKRSNALGASRITASLRMAAVTMQRSKTALGAAFRRIARHKGATVAFFAIARKLAQLIYRLLRFGQDYIDIGETAYEERFRARRLISLAESAKQLGYTLAPATT